MEIINITLITTAISASTIAIGFLIYQKGLFDNAKSLISDLKSDNQSLENKFLEQNAQISELEKQNELLKQKYQFFEKEQQEWEKQKSLYLSQISQEIINKNREEQDKFGANQQVAIKKTTEDLMKNFENVLNKVSSLNDDVKKSSDDINLTKNALLSPGGAGRTSEITLTNLLKNSGLKEKLTIDDNGDFILQSHFSDIGKGAKRPDALVFMPGNQILIIDSKSSPHFLELRKAKEQENQNLIKETNVKIKEAMKRHLDDLKKKNYAAAKNDELDLKHYLEEGSRPIITTIMFLQTEQMLETIRQIDEKFEEKAREAGIHILSPIGLINLLLQAKLLIHRVKQEKNIDKLKIEIKKLIESLSSIFKKSENLGKAIDRAGKAYNDFTGTFNKRLLPRVRNMDKFGIEFDKEIIQQQLQKISNEEEIVTIEENPEDLKEENS